MKPELSEIKRLKDYIYPNGKYSNIHSNQQNIKRRFPEIYEQIKDDYHTKLYMLLHDIKEVPKCKNIKCNNKVKLKSISEGFRSFCCNACIGEFQQTDKEFSEKIHKSKLNVSKKMFFENYSYEGNYDKNYIIIKNKCKHKNVKLYRSVFYKINMIEGAFLCEKCNDEFIVNFIPSEKDFIEQRKMLKSLTNNYLLTSEKNIKRYYPRIYKCIKSFGTKYNDTTWQEELHMFINEIRDRPICPHCNKNKVTSNIYLYFKYNNYCENKECKIKGKSLTRPQYEIYSIIKDLIDEENINVNYKLKNKELDIFIPYLKLAVEYNGFYWHSVQHRDKKYHIDKWNLCKDNNIKLITIWEDDWKYKQDIVKSIIKNSLNQTENKIYARQCQIRGVSYFDTQNFINNNHIQGHARSSINLGLYHNEELVSIMTFGNKRMIMKSHSESKNDYELLRFCSKINTVVIGAASKLFSHFVEYYKPETVVSYANCDISNGNLYEKLGFKFISHTGLNYWWAKDEKRHHRSNFMKHKLVEQGEDPSLTEDQIMISRGYTKIFGTGNLKYVWESQ